jgi:iron complex transport system substrate-binding protein
LYYRRRKIVLRHVRFLLGALFIVLVLGCVNFTGDRLDNKNKTNIAVTVTDGLGREITVHALPQRIVSTVPSNTEILYDLGLKDKVVAVTSHCMKTCDTSGKSIIGGWSRPEIAEKIAELKPDLVLAFGGLQTPLAREMEKRNITTFVFFPKTVDETLAQVISVGKVTGSSAAAEKMVAACRSRLKKIDEIIGGIPVEKRLRCVRLISTRARVIGGRSFQNDMVKRAGGINVFEYIDDDYPMVSFDDVRAKDPDMIIFNRSDEKKAVEWFLTQDGWRDLRSAKEGRLMSISCDHICHPNTRIDRTVEILARRFYPEKFISNEKQ